ncbi:restriction endonuclease [Candidatus Roizmanbacteria bacterium]|nr:restriction endonuclease [Candidatus Roizmanbacteria bacterium]
MVKVQKASGEMEDFSEDKVRDSLKRAGADEQLINDIVVHVKEELYEGMPTEKIYEHIFEILRGRSSHLVARYNLKRAIMELGPTGYPFEKFLAGVLKSYGYDVTTDQIARGKCVSHEIDVIAEKDGKKIMIECKFHNHVGTKSKIRDVLYTYARFLDVREQGKFDEAWLVTNTKVTSDVIDYAQCQGMRIISWNYPKNMSLRTMIEQSNLHPITALDSLTPDKIQALLAEGVVFARDLKENSKS